MENDVLDALEDLGYEGNLLDEGALVKAVQGDDLSFEFMTLCVWIVKELKKVCTLGETLTEVEEQETFKLEMSGLLTELCNPHPTLSGVKSLDSVHNRFLLLDYLTSELQACRMLGGESDEKMEINQQAVSPTLQHIYLIFTALELPLPGKDATIFILFSQIENKIRQMLTRLPKNYLGEPLLKKKLSKNQWSNVEKINNQLNSEYSLRRQMLIKRLDVTVQSFGWSDKAKKNKDELAATFQPLRKSMSSMSTVTVADVLASRTDLLRQPRTSAGAIREKTKCPINRILMGNVPDRGGRPSTMKPPPPEMPSFKKRQEAPKGQRPQSGYGGGGGGGRGRGDGGGRGRGRKVQGNWSGNRGGQGGGYGWSDGGGGGQGSGGYGWSGSGGGYGYSGGGGQGGGYGYSGGGGQGGGYGYSGGGGQGGGYGYSGGGGQGGGYGYSGGGGQGGMHGWAGGGGRGSRGRDFWGMDNQGYNRNEYYS